MSNPFRRVCQSGNYKFLIIFTLGVCGDLKRRGVCQFSVWDRVVDLKGLILDNFHFREGVVILKALILDYWQIWICQITTYRIVNCCLSVCVCVGVCILSYRPEGLADLGNGQVS